MLPGLWVGGRGMKSRTKPGVHAAGGRLLWNLPTQEPKSQKGSKNYGRDPSKGAESLRNMSGYTLKLRSTASMHVTWRKMKNVGP